MIFVFTSCPRTCTTFLIHCTFFILKRYGKITNIDRIPISNIRHFQYIKKHFLCKIENNFECSHHLIPKSNKILIHSRRPLSDIITSFETLAKDNGFDGKEFIIPSEAYYEKYDQQGTAECDLLFEYDDIKKDKHAQVLRLVLFLSNQNLLESNNDIDIHAIIEYADTIQLKWKNHKKW